MSEMTQRDQVLMENGELKPKSASRALIALLVVSALIFSSLALVRIDQLNQPPQITPNAEINAKHLQIIDGFGASGAWWSGPIFGMSKAAKTDVGRLLFSKRGLSLSQFRYNIGGGGVGVSTPWKKAPSFLLNNGSYDFSNDPAGVFFLKMAQSYGVNDLVGFVNSAPSQFTTNGLNCGGKLNPVDIGAFAQYLASVVRGIKTHFGIYVKYLSPFNEPDFSMAPCTQEGMRVPPLERARLISILGPKLASFAPWCHIIADESSQVAYQFLPELPKWIDSFGAKKYVAVLSHHNYDYPGPRVLSYMKTKVFKLGLTSWMTEICCFDGSHFGYQYDPTMYQGMWLAKSIYNDLIFGGDSAFDWWTAISPNLGCDPVAVRNCAQYANILGRNDGLIYYDINYLNDGDQAFYLTKRYFVFGNFSKFVLPGSILHKVTGLPRGVVALASQFQGKWSVVVVDDRAKSALGENLKIGIPNRTSNLKIDSSALTNAQSSWGSVPNASISSNGIISLTSYGQSVSSIEVSQTFAHRLLGLH